MRLEGKEELHARILRICGPGQLCPEGISEAFGVTVGAAESALDRLAHLGHAERDDKGRYRLIRFGDRSSHAKDGK